MVMGVAFGAGVIALSALTICVIAALSLAIGTVWIAALVTGVIEIGLGLLLVHRGARDFEGLSHADGGREPAPPCDTSADERSRRLVHRSHARSRIQGRRLRRPYLDLSFGHVDRAIARVGCSHRRATPHDCHRHAPRSRCAFCTSGIASSLPDSRAMRPPDAVTL